MDPIIRARRLNKTYVVKKRAAGLKGALASLARREVKEIEAVSDVNLEIAPGELVGYIGPNGAGKSTTIKMLSGILAPTSGDVTVCGIAPQKDRIRNALNVGAVFGQKTQLWWDLPVGETFELLRRMYGIPQADYRRNMDEFMDYLDLSPFVGQPVRQLSLGQRMRAEIAASLLHNPKVLFLDEPTIGLDINVKVKVREFVRRINEERGVTVLLTTHDLQDIEQLARRIIVINHGRVGFDGSMDALARKYTGGARRMACTLQRDPGALALPDEVARHCSVTREGRRVSIQYGPQLDAAELIAALMAVCPVTDIDIKGPTIEDVVMEVYNA